MAFSKKPGPARPVRPKLRCPACGSELTPPAEFQRLAEENPLLLLPYIYVYRAKTSLERHQDQFQAQFGQIGELDLSRDIVAFQKATPGQRQMMLEELFMIRPEDGSP